MIKVVVTGCAGFIGSHVTELLLLNDFKVIGIDNLSTGFAQNIRIVEKSVGGKAENFKFFEVDICKPAQITNLFEDVTYCFHLAALGSVPRSIKYPLNTNHANVSGTLSVLNACITNKVKKIIFSSSSSVYGMSSPYAISKRCGEEYVRVFKKCYDLYYTILRYFNVYGPRQSPNGDYAAVIPKWISKAKSGDPIEIYGDGAQTRHFTFVTDEARANLLAAIKETEGNHTIDIAHKDSASLLDIIEIIEERAPFKEKLFKEHRKGDVKSSRATVGYVESMIGFAAKVDLKTGIGIVMDML